jgi:hypothetical protein
MSNASKEGALIFNATLVADDQCDYEPTDGLLDRDGFETRKCCNCGDVAQFFVRTYYGDCDGPSLLSNGRGGFSPEGLA